MYINKWNPLFARESKGNPHGTQGKPVIRLKNNIVYYWERRKYVLGSGGEFTIASFKENACTAG